MTGAADEPVSQQTTLHATCIAMQNRGCLIVGSSGSGKSSLALSLMAVGAKLVADDRVILNRTKDCILASPPPAIEGLIEARGVGLLTCETVGEVPVCVVVDMDKIETERLPKQRSTCLLGLPIALLHRVDAPHFAPALAQFMKSGRKDIG